MAERQGFDANGPRFPRKNYKIPPALMSMAFCAISEFRQDFLEDLPSPFLQVALGRLRKESADPKGRLLSNAVALKDEARAEKVTEVFSVATAVTERAAAAVTSSNP